MREGEEDCEEAEYDAEHGPEGAAIEQRSFIANAHGGGKYLTLVRRDSSEATCIELGAMRIRDAGERETSKAETEAYLQSQ